MHDIEVVLHSQTVIGESPTWSPTEGALYWIDVKAPSLNRLAITTGQLRSWPMGADIGAFALWPDLQGALVALRTGLYHLTYAKSALRLLVPPPFDPKLHRFNEGACDPAGRFWVGVMFDPVDPSHVPMPGALHRFTLTDGMRIEKDASELHNGMAWNADGTTMFMSHSYRREIHRFEMHDGHIGVRTPFTTIPETDGIPDGAAIDTEGGYWCALHGGGRLRRFHQDGTVDHDIPLPVSQPTMCSFGGHALDELYVTTATDGLTPSQLRDEPLAGTLLRLRPGKRGIPRRCTLAPQDALRS